MILLQPTLIISISKTRRMIQPKRDQCDTRFEDDDEPNRRIRDNEIAD